MTDTTATACDTVPRRAVRSAIVELIEKNATLLFWYNNEGFEVRSNQIQKIILPYAFRNIKYRIYANLSFYPIVVAYVALYKNGSLLNIGTGARINYIDAIYKAIREANFLASVESSMAIKANLIGFSADKYTRAKNFSLKSTQTQLKLDSYPKFGLNQFRIKENDNYRYHFLSTIRKVLNGYTDEVYILPINIFNDRLTFKAYSPDLINYVPFKFNLKFDKKVYSRIESKKEEISKLPELPIM